MVRFPGPGTYDGRYEVILKKPPVFSMGERFTKEKSKDTSPGPGAHFPEKVNFRSDSSTFDVMPPLPVLLILIRLHFVCDGRSGACVRKSFN